MCVERGDITIRAAPMKMNVRCKLWEFIVRFIVSNPGVAAEGINAMAACAKIFHLWLRINELFKLKMKHVQLNVSVKPSVEHNCHLVALF